MVADHQYVMGIGGSVGVVMLSGALRHAIWRSWHGHCASDALLLALMTNNGSAFIGWCRQALLPLAALSLMNSGRILRHITLAVTAAGGTRFFAEEVPQRRRTLRHRVKL